MNGWLERYRIYVLFTLLNLLICGGAVFLLRRPAPAVIELVPPPPTPLPTCTPTPAPLRVYVSGAVLRPEVYLLPPGSIVKDAVRAAGGPSVEADLDRINLAQPLADGQQVYVPRKGEEPLPIPAPGSMGDRVNINTATLAELDALPGIGPTLAQRIIDYRTEHGPFASIEDIKNVPGIGEGLFQKLKDRITVR